MSSISATRRWSGEHDAAVLSALERHDSDALRRLVELGWDPAREVRGRRPLAWLLEMYTRSARFGGCVSVLLEGRPGLANPALEAVLLDDVERLEAVLAENPERLHQRLSLRGAFTPLDDVTLLHVAAEFWRPRTAALLLARGADPDATAGVDEFGLGGQSPLFHLVNAPGTGGVAILDQLLAAGARPDLRIPGLVWGRGFQWATTLFDLTPVSYAQYGLLPQFSRAEHDVSTVVRRLLEASGRSYPPLESVQNRYL